MVVFCGINVPSLDFADDSTVSSATLFCGFPGPIASVDTPTVRENAAQFFVLDVRGLVAEPLDKRLVTEDQRSLAFVSQFVLLSGLVRNRRSGISAPRAFRIYKGWCPLAKLVPPLDRNRLSEDGVTNSLYSDFDLQRMHFHTSVPVPFGGTSFTP